MTKRIKSSELVRARKETKRLQHEAKTRIRKARKIAKQSGDKVQLERLDRIEQNFANSLESIGKSKLPKSFKNNVMREKGRAIALKKLIRTSDLSKKKQKRQSKKTFEKLFGKEKTRSILNKIGGREMSRLSNEFWNQLYMAQDMLYSLGIVPADEIMGKSGSIGSGLLETSKELVNDGYWTGIKFEIGPSMTNDGDTSVATLKMVVSEDDTKVETSDLAWAIVEWYKTKYGIE